MTPPPAFAFPDFAWACGEECSDPLVPFGGAIVRVDQLASTGHLDRLEQDLADVAALGITVWRYGMPWRRAEPAPGVYDWALWDRALTACARAGLRPIVDLCHFGLPDHYRGFADSTWVEGFARYVDAFLARYRDVHWFTAVNEPWTTAMQCGFAGAWNDARSSPHDYARILALCILADLEAHARIRADRAALNVSAEVFLCPLVADPAQRAFADQLVALWRASWDLRFGRRLDPLAEPVFAAVPDAVRARLERLATTDGMLAGHDFYPVSVQVFGEHAALSIGERLAAYTTAARAWHARYGVDFWIAETSNLGLPAADGAAWLESFAAALAALRRDGLPVRGLCWYSRGDQHDWHSNLTRPLREVTEVGLFDLRRRPRDVAAVFRRLAASRAIRHS